MSDHWAAEAQRLLNDDTLNKALSDVRQNALEALATATDDILQLQAFVAAVDAIRDELKAMIIRQGTRPDDKASPFA